MSEAISYPRGMKSSIAELNVSASKRLAKCDDMSYEPSSKSFIVEAEPTHGGTDYSNYVSWHEGYFEFVEMESIEA